MQVTMSNIAKRSGLLWVHFVGVWAASFWTYWVSMNGRCTHEGCVQSNLIFKFSMHARLCTLCIFAYAQADNGKTTCGQDSCQEWLLLSSIIVQ